MILEIGELPSKYWNIYWILVAKKIRYFGVKGGVKPKVLLAAVNNWSISGEKVPISLKVS